VLVTHDRAQARRLSQRTIELRAGRLAVGAAEPGASP